MKKLLLLIIGIAMFSCSSKKPEMATKSSGPAKFDDQYLKMQENIAFSSKYSTIIDYMESNHYELDSTDVDEEDNSEYFLFLGDFDQMVIVAYSKNKELMFVKSNLLSINAVLCETELENKNFKQLFSKDEKYEDMEWTTTQYSLSKYPFQYMFEKIKDDEFSWVYLYTTKCEGFSK